MTQLTSLKTVWRNTLPYLFSLLFILSATRLCAQEYPKLILSGDYPDPSIMRDGEDYYMTHSPFTYKPGLLIWHSQNLLDWEPVCRALPDFEGSAWATDLLKYKDVYYIYYPSADTNWVVWAKDIKGPWSKPVDLKVSGIDPGHIADENGNRYLYVDNGMVIRLTADGLSTIGEKKKVYDGWKYPDTWETECMCLEAPKLNYHNGYYYLTSAQGGTAGPATSHMVVSARSKHITGPWENSPYNPIVHTYSADDDWWSKGHGTLVDDVDGNWWIFYHAYAKDYHTLGRSTLMEPVEWTADGWFRTKATTTLVKAKKQIKHGLELSDDFQGPELGLQWTFWKRYEPQALHFKRGGLWLDASGKTPSDGRILLVNVGDKHYETQVEVTVGESNSAGLVLFYDEKAYAGITSDGKSFTIYLNAENKLELPNRLGKHFIARIQNHGNHVTIAVSKDGKQWTSLTDRLDVSTLNHNRHGGFCSLRVGLLSAGRGSAGFSRFCYRAIPSDTLASNPFITHMYTADPSAHVWGDGRLYVYASHDIDPPKGCDLMDRYHVFSTDDMVHWTDHGEILNSGQVSWGRKEGGFMWAPDCAYKDGTYYFYFPHPSGDDWNSTWKVGIATSKYPAKDFKVQDYIENLGDAFGMIDPCVFVDDDGQAYFYYGGGGRCMGTRLKDNMTEIAEPLRPMEGLTDFHEGTWVHKRNGIYYLSYSDNHDDNWNDGVRGDNRMRYATSHSPLGPWKSQGIYMEPTDSYTNHGSIVEFKGQWYAFYHNSALSNHDWLRSICADRLYFDKDGMIQMVKQTKKLF